MNEDNETKPSFIGRLSPLVIVLLGGMILFILMFLINPRHPEIASGDLPWNSVINEQGNVEVIGLETNSTTVIQAKWMFRDDVSVKIFHDSVKGIKFAEAFFPSIHIGTIHAAMVLRINISAEELERMFNRGVKTTINKLGLREVIPNSEDNFFLKNQTFSFITLLPRKNLTTESIKERFGDPEKIVVDNDGLSHWIFPEKGLKLIQSNEGREGLIYQNPVGEVANVAPLGSS